MDPLNDRLLDPPHQPLEVESRKVIIPHVQITSSGVQSTLSALESI